MAMPYSASLGQLALRTIGWAEWDPMGLNGSEGGWRFSDAANAYDRYMLHVLKGLQSGESGVSMIRYLVGIEVDYMGMRSTGATWARAEATVAAICERMGQTSDRNAQFRTPG